MPAKNLLCIRKCWHKGTVFNPGDLVKQEDIESEEDGKMVIPRHFEAIADTDQETINETLEAIKESDIIEEKKVAMRIVKGAKSKE